MNPAPDRSVDRSVNRPMARPVARPAALRGTLRLPSDKSMGHRALIANALSGGPAEVRLREPGADLGSTVAALRALGVAISEDPEPEGTVALALHGRPQRTGARLDCGNSGTSMRLLAGTLAGLGLDAMLDGDASLRARPMERVAAPLRAMGVPIVTTAGCAPLRLMGGRTLRATEHRLEVASAQVLGAIVLAALAADGETRIVTPGPTRDHTERLLAWMGVPVERDGLVTTLRGPAVPQPRSLTVPGDPSAATPWLVAATVHPDAELHLDGVSLNPTRLAAVEVLREMGAAIEIADDGARGPEPTGRITIRSADRLRPITLHGPRVAELIDELPALAVAMAAADGTSELRDAGELRVKESDRIAVMVAGLAAIGARVEELPDGWRIGRGEPRDAEIATHGDHRVAIAFAVAAAAGVAGTVRVDDPACASVSYPVFWEDLDRVGGAAA